MLLQTSVSTSTRPATFKFLQKIFHADPSDPAEKKKWLDEALERCAAKMGKANCPDKTVEVVNDKFQTMKSQLMVVLFSFGFAGLFVALTGGTRYHVIWGCGTALFFFVMGYFIMFHIYIFPVMVAFCVGWWVLATALPIVRTILVFIITIVFSLIMAIINYLIENPILFIIIIFVIILIAVAASGAPPM